MPYGIRNMCKSAMKVNKILVSQPKPTSEKSPYFDIAERYGVEVVFRPFIKVEGLSAREFRQQKININDFTAIIFTARTAIDHFFRLCDEMRVSIPDTMKYFCTTETIALYLQKYIIYRKRKIFHGTTANSTTLSRRSASTTRRNTSMLSATCIRTITPRCSTRPKSTTPRR